MGKVIDYTGVKNVTTYIRWATTTDPVSREENGQIKFYAGYMENRATGVNGNCERNVESDSNDPRKYFGASKNQAWTTEQVAAFVATANNMNTVVLAEVKKAVKEANGLTL